MRFLDAVKYLNLALTDEQTIACLYLESRGLRFMVDFGWANAVAKAEALESKTVH